MLAGTPTWGLHSEANSFKHNSWGWFVFLRTYVTTPECLHLCLVYRLDSKLLRWRERHEITPDRDVLIQPPEVPPTTDQTPLHYRKLPLVELLGLDTSVDRRIREDQVNERTIIGVALNTKQVGIAPC